MPTYAKVVLMGHLGRDPSLKTVGEKNTPLATSSLATNDPYRKNEPATWWELEVFGSRARPFEKFLEKGSLVLVEGVPRMRFWMGRDEQKKSALTVSVNDFVLMGPRPDKPPTDEEAPEDVDELPDASEEDVPF